MSQRWIKWTVGVGLLGLLNTGAKCSDSGSSSNEPDGSDSGSSSNEPDGQDCALPAGSFRVTTKVKSISADCQPDSNTESSLVSFDGTLQGLVEDGCTGTGKWLPTGDCEFLFTQDCPDTQADSYSVTITSPDAFTGVRTTTTSDGCRGVFSLDGVRQGADGTVDTKECRCKAGFAPEYNANGVASVCRATSSTDESCAEHLRTTGNPCIIIRSDCQ